MSQQEQQMRTLTGAGSGKSCLVNKLLIFVINVRLLFGITAAPKA
jgi:hypothetical protein